MYYMTVDTFSNQSIEVLINILHFIFERFIVNVIVSYSSDYQIVVD